MAKITAAELITQNGNVLAARARKALRAPGYVSTEGMCQKFVRQVVQATYGHRFDRYHGASAEHSRRLWSSSPYVVSPGSGSVPGDILYKKGTKMNPFGHVGIRIAGNQVAENSTVHGGEFGGRGIRTLEDFGPVDMVVRLPRIS